MRVLWLLGLVAGLCPAHQLIVDTAWSGDTLMLTAFYADGKPARKATFVLRDVGGAELQRLLADEQGGARTVVRGADSLLVETIHYSHRQAGLALSVPDGPDSPVVAAPPRAHAQAPPWGRLLGGVAALGLVALFFAWRARASRRAQR